MAEKPESRSENLQNKARKHRLQFDLTGKALSELDSLKDDSNATTRAEVVRDALRLYRWFIDQRAIGFSVHLRKGNIKKDVELFF